MKKEKKKTYTYATIPSVKRKATRKAQREGKTLSGKIDEFLNDYVSVQKKTNEGIDLPEGYVKMDKIYAINGKGERLDITEFTNRGE